MKKIFLFSFLSLLLLVGCSKKESGVHVISPIEKQKVNKQVPENGLVLSPDAFQTLAKNPEWTLIDIRNEREMKKFGIIPGTDLQKNVYDETAVKDLENMDPTGKYLIYCYHGNRSFYLKDHLIKDFAFEHVYDLEGGIQKWKDEGYETEKYTK